MALIRKHPWENIPCCEGVFQSVAVIDWTVGNVVGKPPHRGFKAAEQLAYVENQVIENAKKLKPQLEAAACRPGCRI